MTQSISQQDAEEFTQSLGQIMSGSWRQIALAKRLGVPDALGLSVEEWVQKRLGGYVRMSVEERREAVRELADEGHSTRQIAEVLGTSNATVSRDLEAVTNVTDEPSDASVDTPEIDSVVTSVTVDEREVEEKPPSQSSVASVEKQTPTLPPGKYRVLYADPPWKYNDSREKLAGYSGAEDHYPTLTLKQLKALRDNRGRFVGDLAHENAVLFMWATSPLLEDALELIASWRFAYKSQFIWDKVKHNYGHYNSVRHELLLVSTRGSCLPDVPTLIDSVQSVERTERHSEKPEEFRRIIDTLYVPPDGRVDRIELFRRGDAPANWHIWGNEADADRVLQETA